MNGLVLYIPPTMKTFSFFNFRMLVVIYLLLWSAVSAFDFNDPKSSDGGGSLPKPTHSQITDYSGTSENLNSDLEPYIGDFQIDENLYKIGPGDLFQIFIESSAMEKQVNAEGNILLSRIGIIHLDGLSLKEAKSLILDNLQTSHKRANCFVNLSRPKKMRVFLTGAVKEPGVYEVPGNYRLSDGLEKADGFSILAQKDNIRILSKDGSFQDVNFRKFALNGDLQSNPYLTQGCVIQVPFIDFKNPTVNVKTDSGSFTVQMEPGETVLDLILKAHNFAPPEPYTAVVVKEKAGLDSLLLPGDVSSYKPGPGAAIEILSSKQEVFVGGAVSKPGFQVYRSNHRIIQYISEAGLQISSKIPKKIHVIRKNGKREIVPLEEVLYPGDMVYVDQNGEQRFLLYTPVLLSFVSLTLALLSLNGL